MTTARRIIHALLWFSLTVGSTLAIAAPSDNLYNTWQANRQTKHDVAYEAAKRYLEKYSNEARSEAVKAWVLAYEKVLNQSAAPQAPAKAEQTSPSTEQTATPTFEATVQWIQEKVAEYGAEVSKENGRYTSRASKQRMSFNKCDMEVSHDYSSRANDGRFPKSGTETYSVPLQDMDAKRTNVFDQLAGETATDAGAVIQIGDARYSNSSYEVAIFAEEGRKPVKYRAYNGETMNSPGLGVRVTDRDIATRIGRALSHAIAQCRSEQSAQSSRKLNEPF